MCGVKCEIFCHDLSRIICEKELDANRKGSAQVNYICMPLWDGVNDFINYSIPSNYSSRYLDLFFDGML